MREIVDLLEEAGLDELRLRTDRHVLTLRRHEDGAWVRESDVLSPPTLVAGGVEAAGAAPTAPPGEEPPAVDGLHDVRAPLPGTFYRAPKPGDAPFVEIGARVEAHTVVGLVETMKLFNSVTAGIRGTVHEIVIADGEFAHHHALLMRIEQEAS